MSLELIYGASMIYGILRDEIENDPTGAGYAGMTDQEVADSLNAATITVHNFQFTGAELINAIDATEWGALSDAQQAQMKMLISAGGTLDASAGTTTRSLILDAFGSGSQTVTNLIDVAEQTISRAAELGIPEVKPYHVEKVRN